jgi:hypothetical protein
MLRLIKRHTKACELDYQKKFQKQILLPREHNNWKPKNKPEGDYNCKHPCAYVVVGPNPIYDPGSIDPRRKNERIKITLDTQDRAVATQKLREIEHDLILNPEKIEAPTLAYALRSYREVKAKTSRERRRKTERIVFRRQTLFLAARYGLIDEQEKEQLAAHVKTEQEEQERERRIYTVAEKVPIAKPSDLDIDAFIGTFVGKISAMKDNRSSVMSFWKWVSDKKLRPDNIASNALKVATKRDEQQEKDRRIPTFSPEERGAFEALLRDREACAQVLDVENRQDPFASEKTRFLALVQVESAMALVDCVTLAGDEILQPHGDEVPIEHKRWKTGVVAYPSIPLSLAEELRTAFPWNSVQYPFWSGRGDPEHRGKTYRVRLKKLFVAANIRVYECMKRRKSGGVTKAEPELVKDSHGDPHFWRHTWVRDAHIAKLTDTEIASYLGDTVKAVQEHYSSFDKLRQENLSNRASLIRALRRQLGSTTHPQSDLSDVSVRDLPGHAGPGSTTL